MATVDEIRQELNEAKEQLRKAEAAVTAFKEDENKGKWLDELNGKQRRRERLDEDEREKLKELAAEKKQLDEMKEERLKQVEELQRALTAATTTQPGNGFVTRALGT